MSISVELTGQQAQIIVTQVIGLPSTTNKLVYSTVPGVFTQTGHPVVMSFIVLHPDAVGIVFHPRATDGTYLAETALLATFPNSTKVRAAG